MTEKRLRELERWGVINSPYLSEACEELRLYRARIEDLELERDSLKRQIAELEGRDALTEKWMGHAMGGPMPADGE